MPGWGVVALMIPYAVIILMAWIVLYRPGSCRHPARAGLAHQALNVPHHSGAGRRPVAMVAA